MPRVRFSSTALAQLNTLIQYVANDSPGRAATLARKIRRRCATLRRWPTLGHKRPKFGPNVRSFPVGPIVVFYQLVADGREAQILGIIDGRRDLGTVYFSPLADAA